MDQKAEIARILKFWFEDCTPEQWFKKDAAFDEKLEEEFGELVELAVSGKLQEWNSSSAGCLALILLLDQFTRNIYRDTPQAFAGDGKALALTRLCIERGYLADAKKDECTFILMPMMHSEDLAVQKASLPLFLEHSGEDNHDYAVKHHDIIERFGRFPHRNAILGRSSTEEELEFLSKPGSSF